MVGSAQGWREAPYVRCPADTQTLAVQSVSVPNKLGKAILIAPGIVFDEPGQLPDVMRGEEIQIAGALLQNPQWAARSCIVLPGTHSKWAQIENGKIVRFATYLTGELFAVLSKHSILGRLMLEPTVSTDSKMETDIAAFEPGLSLQPKIVVRVIFHTRFLLPAPWDFAVVCRSLRWLISCPAC
jgi:2-dehydro-3-deoxygalactonokinase